MVFAMDILKEEGRLYIKTKSGEAELVFHIEKRVVVITHTFVPSSERGRGLAEKLADEAFSMAKNGGMKVKIQCPYIEYYVSKHPQLAYMVLKP